MKIDPDRGIWRFSRLATTMLAMFGAIAGLSELLPMELKGVIAKWLDLILGILGAGLGIFFYNLSQRPRDVKERKQ